MKKADVRLADIDTDLLTKIRFSIAFPGGIEPPTFRLGAVGLSWRLKSVKSRCAALLLGFFEVRIPLCTPEIRFFH